MPSMSLAASSSVPVSFAPDASSDGAPPMRPEAKCPPPSSNPDSRAVLSPSNPSSGLTPTQRDEAIRLLTERDLALGKGSSKQLRAYRELEWRRCARSYAFFVERYCYITLKGGTIAKWHPWPMQVSSAAEWEAGVSTIEVKARQLGQTTNAAHFAMWDAMFHDAVTWNIVGKDKDSSADVIARLRATIDRLPEWMLERARATTRSDAGLKGSKQDSAESVFTLGFGLSRIHALTSTPKKTQGRAGKVILDDYGAHEEQERKWQLLYPTLDDPDPAARGQVIIIFNGEGENFAYHLYEKAKTAEVPLTPHFYSWDCDPRRDGDWYARTQAAYLITNPEVDEFAFRAQFPSTEREAFVLRGNSRFNLASLNEHEQAIHREREAADAAGVPFPLTGFMTTGQDEGGLPVYAFERNVRGCGRRYLDPEPGALYVIGVDAAGGRQSADYSVAMVCKVHPGGVLEQAYVYQAKVEPQDELAYQAICLAHHYNEALMVPETGSSGHGSSFVSAVKEEYGNIYQEMRTSRRLDEFREELGYSTNRASRNPLLDSIGIGIGRFADGAWQLEPTLVLHDQRTLDELLKFEIDAKTGRAEAPKGSHDDLVMALGLCIVGSRNVMYLDQTPVTFSPLDW